MSDWQFQASIMVRWL